MRIYELAKELGVENKVILSKAAELGMHDKASHSNSLRPDEADKIRRAMLRQAVGSPGTSETVTKRVDHNTGTTNTLVERRVGNVIRRRKQSNSDDSATVDQVEILETPISSSENGESPQSASHTHSAVHDHQQEEAPPDLEPTIDIQPIEVVEDDILEPVVEEVREVVQVESAIEESVPEAERVSVDSKTALPKEGESKPVIPGPKVLGRMSLPQKKIIKSDSSRSVGSNAATAFNVKPRVVLEVEEDDEDLSRKRGEVKKKTRKREISRIDLVDYEGRDLRRPGKTLRSQKNKGDSEYDKKSNQLELTRPKASKRIVRMDETITVGELAKQMSLKAGEVIAKLMELGILATINQAIDSDTATIIAEEFEFQIERTGFDEKDVLFDETVDDPASLKFRPPVVTVMGHVDHGKTSLLDAIRKTSVAAKEHGGITQHIGAYGVELESGKSITFIDTPGHAAFTQMRARGAQVTDVVILVVAADDGVMPQTIEAVSHAKAAKVPIVVAVNKCDKPDSKPDRIKQQLSEHGLNPEEWGGDTLYFNLSAITGAGIKELLEGLLLLAEMRELKANPDRAAKGTIIESKQDKGRGTVATVLVQTGTLRVGDIFVMGAHYGRVRSMDNDRGEKVIEAGPAKPVEITGLAGMPEAGDDFFVVEDEATARQVSMTRAEKRAREERALASGPISLEEFARRANNLVAAELNVILKADVAGSVEAVREAIEKLTTPKVKVRVLHAGVGGISESDIQLATASKAIVVGFGVRAEPRAASEAERVGVQIRFYRVIYELVDDVKKAMVGLLDPVRTEVPQARVEVRDTFSVSKIGTIAGCYVLDGTVRRSANIRVVRDSRVIFEGKMSSLKRFKDDVKEVQAGYECGIGVDRFNDVKVGDIFEIFEIKESEPSLD